MSVLSALVEHDLLDSASHAWEASGVSISVRGLVRSLRVARPDPAVDLSRYTGWGVQTLDNAESQIRPIVYRGGARRTIGYVFPIGTFDPASDFSASNLDDEFQRIYSNAAATLIVERGIANDLVRQTFEGLPDESNLSDLFDADCAVVVLASRIMAQEGVDEGYVKLALQEYGYFPTAPQEKAGYRPYVSLEPGRRKVAPVSAGVVRFVREISEVVSIASRQESPIAAFIAYYQVVEILSHERFKSEVARIADDAVYRADSWLLKDKLSEAANERKRVNALFANCMRGASNVVGDVERAAKRILGAMATEGLDTMSAADMFYKVRNVLVHDQKAIPASSYPDLLKLVDAVHLLVFALVQNFDPAFDAQVATGSIAEAGAGGSESEFSEQMVVARRRLSESKEWLEKSAGGGQDIWLRSEVERHSLALAGLERMAGAAD